MAIASILPHTHKPRMKNSFFLVDKNTRIQEKKINFFLKEMYYVGLHKQHSEVFFILNTILVGNANNFFF